MIRKIKESKILKVAIIVLIIMVIASIFQEPVYGKGHAAGAIESTWKDASKQIKEVVDKVVFPTISLILAVPFFVKLGTNYFEYKKYGSFEFTAPALLFMGLILALTEPLYVWKIIGM